MNQETNNYYKEGGVTLLGLLQLTFIVLKLCGVISWAWVYVLLPAIISTGFGILMLIVALIIFLIVNKL